MFPLVALALLITPIVELYVIVQVSGAIGFGKTLVVLVGMSVLGALLLRSEGLGVLRRIQARTAQGEVPSAELVDGALIVMGGSLMLTPGFVTDVIGMTMIFPPTRILFRRLAMGFFGRRVKFYSGGLIDDLDSARWRPSSSRTSGRRSSRDDGYVDVEGWEEDDEPPGIAR